MSSSDRKSKLEFAYYYKLTPHHLSLTPINRGWQSCLLSRQKSTPPAGLLILRSSSSLLPPRHLVTTLSGMLGLEAAKLQDPFCVREKYHCTPPKMSMAELEQNIAAESSVDLVTIATAIHWFDLPSFYQQVKWVLKKPNGVIAAWTYNHLRINENFDTLLTKMFVDATPFLQSQSRLLEENYRTIDFPFEPVDGLEHTGPFEFKMEKLMDLEGFFTLIKSGSPYQTAKEKGVELLGEDLVKDFTLAWNEDGKQEKVVTWPVYMRIGKVGNQ